MGEKNVCVCVCVCVMEKRKKKKKKSGCEFVGWITCIELHQNEGT